MSPEFEPLDDSFVSQRRSRRRESPESSFSLSLDDSFTESPIRSNNVTRRRNRQMSDSIDWDSLNETMMQSPEEMEIADSQHIDLDTPPRRRRGENEPYDNIFNIGNTSRVSISDADASISNGEPVLTEQEIEAENQRQLAILQENAKFDIDQFDTEDKRIELPVVSMSMNLQDIFVYDFINIREIPLKQFLEEDADNIAFKYGDQTVWMGIDRNLLAESVKNPSQIKYSCLDKETVIEDKLYYQLRGIGFPAGVVSIHTIGAILRDKTNRLYKWVPSKEVLKSTVSYGYIHYYLPASDLCKEGNEAVVYTGYVIRNTESVGGEKSRESKKKHRTQKRTQKKHRTQKKSMKQNKTKNKRRNKNNRARK